MKLMLPLKYVNEQDKRALWLYFAIAFLGALCMVAVLFFFTGIHFGNKAGMESPAVNNPKTPIRNR
ncbi:MAG: hypothetical protein JST84_20820 [Acidobacteria bacterium]|nr:hypothetical protein [Acidobacteriota bacterium]